MSMAKGTFMNNILETEKKNLVEKDFQLLRHLKKFFISEYFNGRLLVIILHFEILIFVLGKPSQLCHLKSGCRNTCNCYFIQL